MMARALRAPLLARGFATAPHGVTTVGVVGLGLMGHGIAQAAAEKGFKVLAVETEQVRSGWSRQASSCGPCAAANAPRLVFSAAQHLLPLLLTRRGGHSSLRSASSMAA